MISRVLLVLVLEVLSEIALGIQVGLDLETLVDLGCLEVLVIDLERREIDLEDLIDLFKSGGEYGRLIGGSKVFLPLVGCRWREPWSKISQSSPEKSY